MKQVLIISYYWPPSGGPGVQRWLKFSKYLPDFGIQPFVITVDSNYAEYPMIDNSLLSEVQKDTKVIRTKTWEPFAIYKKLSGKKKVGFGNLDKKPGLKQKTFNWIRANLFVPDARKYWKSYAVSEAVNLIQKEQIQAIVTTGPPHSTHLIGLSLKEQFPNINWIADFRDPWSNFMFNESLPKTEWAKKKESTMESKVIDKADMILCATQGILEDFSPKNTRARVILNGYDENDIPTRSSNANKKFRLTYIGNFRANQNIDSLWQALKELKNESLLTESTFELQLVGNVDGAIVKSLKEFGIFDLVSLVGYQDHGKAMQLMVDANMLLLIIPDVASKMSINTGKIFEYMASRVPILAIGPEKGNADNILKECKLSGMIEYSELSEIKRAVSDQIKNNTLSTETRYEQFSRKNLTKAFVEAMNSIPQ